MEGKKVSIDEGKKEGEDVKVDKKGEKQDEPERDAEGDVVIKDPVTEADVQDEGEKAAVKDEARTEKDA